ncbi:SRPBCC family protein [Flavobacterium sp.]|uniref:SRPBCC family protein n=1 Tax=Flavobacterium sp. TaxID=239 RepID=UPI003D6AC08C
MENLEFKIEINASAATVWKALWEDQNYRQWTTAFCDGSYAKTDWKEGSRVHFLAPAGDGMYSTIETLVPNKKMFFSHIGEIKNFEEQPLNDETRQWSGARENYTLSENNGTTTLQVDLDITEKYADYFKGAFPKGLTLVKEIAEKLNG